MNQISEVMTTLIHYNVVIRDSLEYCLKKDAYDMKAYEEKKRSILAEVDQNTPLKSILDHSEENGKKLETLIREFHEKVYGDDSTVLKAADDGLRVDHAQHLVIYDAVIPIHGNVEAMILGVERDAHNKKIDVSEASKVNKAENRLFVGVALMTMVGDLVKLFGDYNQARREAKGEESPSSRFIGNDIGHIIGLVNNVKANSHLTDEKYKHVEDQVTGFVEMITGRRDLPKGKNFGDVIKETQDAVGAFVRDSEPEFRQIYPPLITALIEQARKDSNSIKPTVEAKPAEPEVHEVDGEPIELDPMTGLPKA